MGEMRDKIAKAIYDARRGDSEYIPKIDDFEIAEAVLAALRDPTRAMIDAAISWPNLVLRELFIAEQIDLTPCVAKAFRAMIDAA
jgi:hypothetical protein